MPFFKLATAPSAHANEAVIVDGDPDGIFDLETVPVIALQDLCENKMRYAIHATTREAKNIELHMLPTAIIAVPIDNDVFISNIYRDGRARWLLRGISKATTVEFHRRGEMTRFMFKFPDRQAYLFVRLSPPHHVDVGLAQGELTVRISRFQDAVDFGLLSELSIAAGELAE